MFVIETDRIFVRATSNSEMCSEYYGIHQPIGHKYGDKVYVECDNRGNVDWHGRATGKSPMFHNKYTLNGLSYEIIGCCYGYESVAK